MARAMASSGEKFAQDGVFRRFLKQKGGIANIFMATFCCALSVRLLQQRKENEDLVESMEGAFAAERESLRAEIDALKGRGWFGSRAAEKPKPSRRETRAGGEGEMCGETKGEPFSIYYNSIVAVFSKELEEKGECKLCRS